ncbi:hypothetical protein [Agrobacterium larrymoorei]|uniref:Uncharacterized protein n=1 Tax=Agrobacterium larrymoorei TaxID=160699 RepID=A0ABU0UGX8_9HYPH|nr:hypothetical protein [Agrobacterium larrymoorei]MDQ1184194.1 hypothetical protein [Agrobacterium larrymoorei]
MPKKQKRDSGYYEERLRNEFPLVYADLKAGKHRTITEASIAAGIKTGRTRLHELKNAWKKASASERLEFVGWLKTTSGTSLHRSPKPVFTKDNYLEPWAKKRIDDIMQSRGITARSIRDQIGIPAKDTSLESAFRGSRILKRSTRDKIEQWLLSQPSP